MPSRNALRWFYLGGLIVCSCVFSGCALLALPAQIVGGVFDVVGKAFTLANGLPKPPPWVFF